MTTPRIPLTDAAIVKRGEARFPVAGMQCNTSCCFYAFCQNSNDFGKCNGFVLMQGADLELMQRNLDSDSIEYIKNSFAVIQRSLTEGDTEYADIVTRDISRLGEYVNQPKPPQKEPVNISVFETYQLPVNANIQKPAVEPKEPEPPRIPYEDLPLIIERGFVFEAFTPPEICMPDQCPNIHCGARKEEHRGKPCIYKEVEKNP
jgi:hypothetical protein